MMNENTPLQMITNEDLTEYIKSSSEAMENMLKAILTLNNRIDELQDTVDKFERIAGSLSVK